MPRQTDWRLALFSVAAIAFGAWAVMALAPVDSGTLARVGPGLVPKIAATALVVVGVVILVRATTGLAASPPRLLPGPLRLTLMLLLVALLLLPEAAALSAYVPALEPLAASLADLSLRAGPPEILVVVWLRWTLAIALGVIAAGEGALSGLASLLIGLLVGLAGEDVGTAETRLEPLAALRDEVPWALEASVVIAMLACSVSPLPAALAYTSAVTAEESLRRAMLMSRGEPLEMMLNRPFVLATLSAIALIVVVLAWHRRPRRRQAMAVVHNP